MNHITRPTEFPSELPRHSSGISGLDELLNGGFVQGRLYLVTGPRGTGKSTVGMTFLEQGLNEGDEVLFIHGEESSRNLLANAAQLDIDLSGAAFLDIGPESDYFSETPSYDVAEPHVVDEGHNLGQIRNVIEEFEPDRVLIDPISQFRYLEPTEYQYRRRLIAFTRFLTNQGPTVVVTQTTPQSMDIQIESLSDGVIQLEFDDDGRRITIPKHRGVGQRDGTHGLEIAGGTGVEVYPSLVPDRHGDAVEPGTFHSGIPELDSLLGGGLETGSVTIISGPTGVGKSTTATEFLTNLADDGETVLAYLFEESVKTFTRRAEQFGIPISELRDSGHFVIEEIDPLNLSPEEFASHIKHQTERRDVSTVLIDGISGYKTSIKGGSVELDLRVKLHALARYLSNQNISVLLIDEQTEVAGLQKATSANVSYLADNILFLNYLEYNGEIQRVAGVLKKRVGDHESVPRRFWIDSEGLQVDEPLANLHGILNGIPEPITDPGASE